MEKTTIYVSAEAEATDTIGNRAKWFAQSLDQIGNWLPKDEPRSMVVPLNIGCGLAGGRWNQRKNANEAYLTMLQNCAQRRPNWNIVVYRFQASKEFDTYDIDATMNRGNEEFHETYRAKQRMSTTTDGS